MRKVQLLWCWYRETTRHMQRVSRISMKRFLYALYSCLPSWSPEALSDVLVDMNWLTFMKMLQPGNSAVLMDVATHIPCKLTHPPPLWQCELLNTCECRTYQNYSVMICVRILLAFFSCWYWWNSWHKMKFSLHLIRNCAHVLVLAMSLVDKKSTIGTMWGGRCGYHFKNGRNI